MSRRDTIRQRLDYHLRTLISAQAKSLKTGPIDMRSSRLFLYYGLLLRCLPHYTEEELVEVQRLII